MLRIQNFTFKNENLILYFFFFFFFLTTMYASMHFELKKKNFKVLTNSDNILKTTGIILVKLLKLQGILG